MRKRTRRFFSLLSRDAAARRTIADDLYRLGELVQHANDAVFVLTSDGRILQANRRAEEMYAYAQDELRRLTLADLRAESTRAATQAALDAAAQRDGLTLETVHRRADGSEFPVDVSLRHVEVGGEGLVIGSVRDITAHRQEEAARFEALTLFSGFAEASQYGMGMAELDGRIVYVNPTLVRMLGEESAEACLGKHFPTAYYAEPMTRKLEEEVLPALMREGQWHGELELLARDGRRLPTDENYFVIRDEGGRPRYFADILTDIAERRKAEQAFRESEQLVRTMMNATSDLVHLIDEDGTIIELNEAMAQALGAPREALIGKCVFDVHADTAAKRRRELLARVIRERQPARFVDEATAGAVYESSIYPVASQAGEKGRVVVFVRDITEQRRVERELRENEARLGLALESAGLGFWDADLETGEVVLSERWASMLGYTAQELRGDRDPWRDRIHPDDLAAALRALERHTNGETEVYESEHRLRTRSGGWIWVNDWGRVVERAPDGKARRIIGAQRDISDRKQTEAALRESEARYRSFFEQDLTGDFITTVGGAIVECNPTFARTFGFASAERAKGTDITLLYPDPSQRRVFLDRLRRERQLTYFEQTLRRLDGTPVHVVENAVGSFDERGELVSIKGYLFDITAQKQAEEQLRGAQKMEAVGRLAGGVAHDFNNLLQAMVGVTQLLQMQRPDDREVQAAVGEMAQLVKRATALTRQLLLFAHRGATRLEKLDLNEVVREAAAMLRRLVHANVHFTLEQPEATLHAPGDAGQLEQVLMNLVVNAVDAMPEGGRLTIRTGRARGRVWFEVADTGTGVPVEVRDKIFDPFFTTKAKGKGTGLGLSVVHGIVAAHGGHIALTTEVGQGTTVRIELPASGSGVYPAVPEAAADTAAQGTGERLLVVEDDATVRAQLQATLQAFGYEVHAAATGEDAGALPGEPGFDLLLTDVMLPGASGVAVARELRDRWPGLKVVMMSGYAEDEVLREEILAGQVRFLQKPVDATTLAREVRGALDEG